jgi:hypothetical protein
MHLKLKVLSEALNGSLRGALLNRSFPSVSGVFDFRNVSGGKYLASEAQANRQMAFAGLSESDFPGACLPRSLRCKPV